MLGYILARAGVDVMVLEKHEDFFRDFRGDTIHPSTFTVVQELGLLDEFLKVRHDEISQLTGSHQRRRSEDRRPSLCSGAMQIFRHDAAMGFLELPRRARPASLDVSSGDEHRSNGLALRRRQRRRRSRADALEDARSSSAACRRRRWARFDLCASARTCRRSITAFRSTSCGCGFRAKTATRRQISGTLRRAAFLSRIDRGDYFQCAFVIRKGGFDEIKARGIQYLRDRIAELAPYLADRVDHLKSFDDVKLLTVSVNRLPVWARPGLLFIGDAAHAMSPIGGVGINLAIQDAVAAANILAGPLKDRTLHMSDLNAVQRRREFPTKVIQGVQTPDSKSCHDADPEHDAKFQAAVDLAHPRPSRVATAHPGLSCRDRPAARARSLPVIPSIAAPLLSSRA